MRATVVTPSSRRIQPIPANGTNQTDVPRKNMAKKRRAAAMLGASAARTPAATNGGQRLTPVRKPSAAAPGRGRPAGAPIVTNSEPAQERAQLRPTEYAYLSSTKPNRR